MVINFHPIPNSVPTSGKSTIRNFAVNSLFRGLDSMDNGKRIGYETTNRPPFL